MRSIDEWWKEILKHPGGVLLVDESGVILARQDPEHGPSIHLDGHWFTWDIFTGRWRVAAAPESTATQTRVVLSETAVREEAVQTKPTKDLVVTVFNECSAALVKLDMATRRRCLAALLAIYSE